MPFNKEISLIAVEGTPSSSFSSLIFLRATIYLSKQLINQKNKRILKPNTLAKDLKDL